MDLAELAAAPLVFSAGGKTYKVAPLSFLGLGTLQQWINDHARSPYDLAKSECDRLDVPDGERQEWLAGPRRQSRGWKPPQVGIDPGWLASVLDDPDGPLFLLYVALDACHPGIAAEEVREVARAISPSDFAAVVRKALGIADAEGSPGPKADPPPTPTPS